MVELTLNSKAATEIPDAAPVPDKPMKCSLPMLLANSDAPTYNGAMTFCIKTLSLMTLTGKT
jgi:hypothetical protein